MKKTLTLSVILISCVHKISSLHDDFPINLGCNKEIERGERRPGCYYNEYGQRMCDYYPIISKTIRCNFISTQQLKLYEDQDETNNRFQLANYPVTLEVTNSEIPVLPTSIFQNLRNLTTIYMENVKLKTIMPSAFIFLDKLKELYLAKNELTAVSDGIFNTLPLLEHLDLSSNKIKTVTAHAFIGTNLRNLNLGNNNISSLNRLSFQPLTHLSTLDVSQNNLNNTSFFEGLSVQKLNVSHNHIEAINFDSFQNIDTLIDISFNHIITLTNFNETYTTKIILRHNGITNLEENYNVIILDISYNNLETIKSNLFNDTLQELYVSSNSITEIEADAFFGLKDLVYLYLDNNNISSLPNSCFKDLTSLSHLNLSGNKLEYFKFGTFDALSRLEVLDISNNNFKELPQYTFHSLTALMSLTFRDNEISNFNVDDLLDHLTNLKNIDLDRNIWTCHKLVSITHALKSHKISFPIGEAWDENNIHGIKCYETFTSNDSVNRSKLDIDLTDSKLISFFNEDFTKTILYKYFNENFKESQFYKYLENLKIPQNKIESNSSNQSEMYSYFNKDFKNSSFFKYFENFRTEANKSEKADNNLVELEALFQNLLKDLKNYSKTNRSSGDDFLKSDMYKYFNEEFRKSNFFKYLENLDIKSNNTRDMTAEKLTSSHEIPHKNPNYTALLSVITILLTIIACAMIYKTYQTRKGTSPSKEQVELI